MSAHTDPASDSASPSPECGSRPGYGNVAGSTSPDDSATMLEGTARLELEKYLLPGEKLLWSDRPNFSWRKALRHFAPVTIYAAVMWIFMFPFMSMFLLHSLNISKPEQIQAASAGAGTTSQPDSADTTALISSPEERAMETRSITMMFVLSGFCAAFLTLWTYVVFQGMNARALLHPFAIFSTYYGLTDKRVLILNTRATTSLHSYHLLTASDLRCEQDGDNTGSIFAGKAKVHYFWIDTLPLYIQSIDQPARVFQLIAETQDKLLRSATRTI
ncbi:MAG: hypothetical protein ACAI35_06950 [Candidatus Methylacidiphilales bacterium]|nr:hypothetical protein [Candidatus Methylacidiphilales bacterium]